jgi:hypothetical protein
LLRRCAQTVIPGFLGGVPVSAAFSDQRVWRSLRLPQVILGGIRISWPAERRITLPDHPPNV